MSSGRDERGKEAGRRQRRELTESWNKVLKLQFVQFFPDPVLWVKLLSSSLAWLLLCTAVARAAK